MRQIIKTCKAYNQTMPDTLVLLHMNEFCKDDSPYGHECIPIGKPTLSTAQKKFGRSSLDQTGGGAIAVKIPSWRMPKDDFILDMWVYWINASSPAPQGLFFSRDGADTNNKGLCLWNGSLSFYCDGLRVISYTWSPSNNTWYHICASRVGNTMRLFIDGTIVATDTSWYESWPPSHSMETYKSAFDNDGSYYLNGYIDELRLISGVGIASNFTPPSKMYTNILQRIPRVPIDYYGYNQHNIVPIMTSNTTPYGVVSASSYVNGHEPWKVFNRTALSASDDWASDGEPTQYIQYQFPSAKIIKKYIIRARYSADASSPTSWTLRGSNDGFASTDELLDTRSGMFTPNIRGGVTPVLIVTNPGSYTYYRLVVTAATAARVDISMWEMYE